MGNSTRPMVSVVIPHYGGKEILSECLISLKNCTYQNIEIIVVDNNVKVNCLIKSDHFQKFSNSNDKDLNNFNTQWINVNFDFRNTGTYQSYGLLQYVFLISHPHSKIVHTNKVNKKILL